MDLKILPVWQRLIIGVLGFMVVMVITASLAGSAPDIGIFLIITSLFIYPIVFYRIAFKKDTKIMIRCPNCKYEGVGEFKTKGSFGVEVILWLLLIIPGIIYSVWRLSNKRWICPQCNFDYIVKVGPMIT